MGPSNAWRRAVLLSIASVTYTVLEGVASTTFGAMDQSLSLFGFGIDSFAEVASGVGVLLMTWRLWRQPATSRSQAESRALLITSWSFFVIAVALLVSGVSNLMHGRAPITTTPGVVISLISIAATLSLVVCKRRIGRLLSSEAILADARCGALCISMSVVLLLSSLLYALWGIRSADSIGAIALAVLSFREGKTAWLASRDARDPCAI